MWTCLRLFFLFLLMGSSFITTAQQSNTRFSSDLRKALQRNSDTLIPVLIKGNTSALQSALAAENIRIIHQYGDILRINATADQLKLLGNLPFVEVIDAPMGKLHVLNDVMLQHNNVDSAHSGIWPLPQAYDGSGVVMGIIDAPVDFRHPDFTDSLGNTRFKYLWDQSIPDDGSAPSPYGYGIECDSQSIAEESCPHIDYTYWYSHGSGVAGVATSSGNAANAYRGVAPNADIIYVALDFESDFLTAALDAITYIFNLADSLGKPCVINTSFGLYSGSHDGNDITTEAIENLLDAAPGRAIVAAAGNAGNQLIHLGYPITVEPQFTWFKKLSYTNLVYWQFWADTADLNNVYFSIAADNPTGWIPKGSSSDINILEDFDLTDGSLDSLIFPLMDGATLIGNVTMYAGLKDGVYMVECYIVPTFSWHYWRLTAHGSGRFDLWGLENFTGFSNFVTTGLPDAGVFPAISQYRMPDTDQSMVSSWQCSDHVITVGSYVNRDTMTNYYGDMPPLVDTVGQVFYSSSHGPTRDGKIKPDITSTGARVLTTGSAVLTDWLIGLGAANYMSQDGQHYLQNGTSFASPAVAGIAALYFQKNPEANWTDLKEALLSNARQDSLTGSDLPNNTWGYGKADAFRTLTGNWGCDAETYLNPPTGLNVALINSSQVLLEWDLIPASAYYQVMYAKTSGGAKTAKKSYVNQKSISGLEPATTYVAKVRAHCTDFGYSTWSEPITFTTLPAREAEWETTFQMYPNPANNYCIMELDSNFFHLTIRNSMGQLVYKADNVSGQVIIPLEELPAGFYVVEVDNTNRSYRQQLLILR